MVLKYKVKIADYRLQTTKKEPRQTPHYKVRLVFIFSSQKLPFEKARDTLVLLFSRSNYELSLYLSTVCGPWTGRKRRERVFLTTEEQ